MLGKSVSLIGAALLAACTEPREVPVYAITFHNTETFSYGGPLCYASSSRYCGDWNPQSYTFGGTLYNDPADRITIAGVDFTKVTQPGDGMRFEPSGVGCHFFDINGKQANVFSGTFVETTDCHGAGRRGTFEAVRVDVPG